jgi:hypothetical protein
MNKHGRINFQYAFHFRRHTDPKASLYALCGLAILLDFEEAIDLLFEHVFLPKNAIAIV